MSKKVLAISSSFRKGSNSEALADAFLKGAAEAGYDTEKVCLGDKNIGFCRGCLACLKTGRCAFNDDAVEIAEKMLKADVLVFATPVYYYSVSGQLKTMLDRANPLYGQNYAFRRVYLLTSAAESADSAQEGAIKAGKTCGYRFCGRSERSRRYKRTQCADPCLRNGKSFVRLDIS